jgi:hypothetical protein
VTLTTVFAWIEASGPSVWIRESQSVWVFPFILILHTVGLAFLVGTNIALDARLLGVGRGVPLTSMDGFFRAMWLGFWVNACSGVLLLIAYPTKALTNPLFYVKLALVAAGLAQLQWIRRQIRHRPELNEGRIPAALRAAAVASLVFWTGAITAGRLLAYTYTRLMATDF